MKRIVRYAYHEQASLQKASKIAAHEPQQNLLPQQNNPNLDMVFLYLQVHIEEQEFHMIQDTFNFKTKKKSISKHEFVNDNKE